MAEQILEYQLDTSRYAKGSDQKVKSPLQKIPRGGEVELMAALLSDGIEAYINAVAHKDTVGSREHSDATLWVETENHSYVFSFDNVCESLGIDPEYMRKGLQEYTRRGFNGHGSDSLDLSQIDGTQFMEWRRVRRPRR